jgi:hypothetical protein
MGIDRENPPDQTIREADTGDMRTLTIPTLGLLLDLADQLFRNRTELGIVMMRCDLMEADRGGEVVRVLQNNLLATRAAAEAGDAQAHTNLLRFVRLIVEKRASHPLAGMSPQQQDELREAMLLDGYELTWEPPLPWDDSTSCTIRPTDVGPVPLTAEVTALEHELRSRGYDVALNHYQQAVALFERHHEAANGQLRTALEELVMCLAADHTGYTRPDRAGDGGNAINHLRQSPRLVADNGGDMLKGLWAMTHTSGSHPGRSDAEETRFRLHVITATARLLLHRFPANP